MKLLYTNENRLLVNNVLNLVENAGITISLKNEFAGGAAGLLVPHETWLEVWVEDTDYDRAKIIIQSLFNTEQQPGWVCNQCSEYNDASFDYCWNCQYSSDQ
ncbi:hypothetical protein A9Q78_00290 [Methylophaga sp. 41_12_T18]|nr:hypothetical protein A9Q78_00290 [Methylophaga sp. 41_12_T18]